jgi:hypothetical protein
MKNIFPIVFFILIIQSCVTTDVRENEMKFTGKKNSFYFKIGDKTVIGDVENSNSRFDLFIKINDDVMTGEINTFYNNITFSLIYNNEFVKGTFVYDSDKRIDRVKFDVMKKKMTGEISYDLSSARFDLLYDEKPLICNWTFDPGTSTINWTFSMDKKTFSVVIKEKAGTSLYFFDKTNLEDDEIIIFVLLELRRMIR